MPQLLMLGAPRSAAEKAVSRQNEFCSKNSTGRNGYEAFVDAQRKKAASSQASASSPEGFLSGGPSSVSHATGLEARASSVARDTCDALPVLVEPQGTAVGPSADDLGQGRLRSGAFRDSAGLFCIPASARQTTGKILGGVSTGPQALAVSGLSSLDGRFARKRLAAAGSTTCALGAGCPSAATARVWNVLARPSWRRGWVKRARTIRRR